MKIFFAPFTHLSCTFRFHETANRSGSVAPIAGQCPGGSARTVELVAHAVGTVHVPRHGQNGQSSSTKRAWTLTGRVWSIGRHCNRPPTVPPATRLPANVCRCPFRIRTPTACERRNHCLINKEILEVSATLISAECRMRVVAVPPREC